MQQGLICLLTLDGEKFGELRFTGVSIYRVIYYYCQKHIVNRNIEKTAKCLSLPITSQFSYVWYIFRGICPIFNFKC